MQRRPTWQMRAGLHPKSDSTPSRSFAASTSDMAMIPPDWKEFLSTLLSENTRFLLIGAHALAYHVEARLTEDLDVWVEPTRENTERVLRALDRFGFGGLVNDASELAVVDRVFMLGNQPWRIDILTGIDGVTFD